MTRVCPKRAECLGDFKCKDSFMTDNGRCVRRVIALYSPLPPLRVGIAGSIPIGGGFTLLLLSRKDAKQDLWLMASSAPIPASFITNYPPDGTPTKSCTVLLSCLWSSISLPIRSSNPSSSWALSQRAARATACVYRRLRRFELRAKSQKTLDAPLVCGQLMAVPISSTSFG
jgi:hypothetical protein